MRHILFTTTAALTLHTFGGYNCNNDCAELAAGYAWAEEHSIKTLSGCLDISEDFRNGCFTYLGDPKRGSAVDDQGADIDQ